MNATAPLRVRRALAQLVRELQQVRTRFQRPPDVSELAEFPEAALLAARARAEWFRRTGKPGSQFTHLGRVFRFELVDGGHRLHVQTADGAPCVTARVHLGEALR